MSRRTTALLSALALLAAGVAQAQDKPGGPIREMLRERFVKKQQELPAPQASTDLRAKITRPGDATFSFVHGGITRYYRVHVPARYDPATPAPLLIALHGGGGSMDYMANDEHYGQIAKAERENYVVVFPNGYSKFASGKFATWNAGSCCAQARDENIDDVGFVREMIGHLQRQLSIDDRRIFATGMSNGGMLAHRLACEMAGTIRAVASVAGTIGVATCLPKAPVAVLHIHAKDDDHVVFGGGAGPKAQDRTKVPEFVSVPETISRWVRTNKCDPNPKRVLERPGATCERYSGCEGGANVQLCVTETGGHSWPGGEKSRAGETSKAISANDVMWDFFNGR